MRPLWRNTLWLGFAAACGAGGFWYGLGWGSEMTWNLAFQNRVSDDFYSAQRALVALADPELADPAYAERNLRLAIEDIGQFHEAWMSCYPRDRQTIAAAKRYTKDHPKFEASSDNFRKGLAACPDEAGAPAPPIASGRYRFQLRDPEFPQMDPIPLVASVDGPQVVFETVEANPRFPKGTRFEGRIAWHAKSRNWVLVASDAELAAEEVGGCTGGPEVLDLGRRVFWLC